MAAKASDVRRAKSDGCEIVATGKRRDGGTRFWCLFHRADATAKYGVRAPRCRYAHVPPIRESEILSLEVGSFSGGVGLWGAVPPVYDTTEQPLDRGVHVHARRAAGGDKEIDATYRAVRLVDSDEETVISELDAIYFMVTTVFGYTTRFVECTYCRWPHLDKDWFSIHPHRGHLCAGCGRHFRDTESAIGNPVARILERYTLTRRTRQAKACCKIDQSKFPGGIQIWGSNTAMVWTSNKAEDIGIHVHAFGADRKKPALDETYATVEVDGVVLDSSMVRALMAQRALPHIENRVVDLTCERCGAPHFDEAGEAFTPHVDHHCSTCRRIFGHRGRLKKTVGNPLVGVLGTLARSAPRPPQVHELGLIPETL
jgi:hypothetical protein